MIQQKKNYSQFSVRDAMLYVKMRFELLAGKGVTLDQHIKDKITKDANKIIISVKLQKRGDISLFDQAKSQEKLLDQISSNSWWREMLQIQRNRSRQMEVYK
ncbi:MAG UNVERIFIED_CONTAM: hypothetical protein LVQ98_03580 [Rickettsiaceae bacterium]|jgi:hypothetical protein